MLRVGTIAVGVGLALLTAGCNTLDRNLLREGAGIDVPAADIVAATDIQDIYFGEVCRQAGVATFRQPPNGVLLCDEAAMSPLGWSLFVQAGMNDIDRRCDAYLAWLDDRRRWREPFLKQLHSTAAVTAAVMGLTGVGATPIAIVGAAFGFAQETFVNLSGRLITEINQSTVQSLVLTRQGAYRGGIGGKLIPNKPAAAYALRSYLRICMPMTIETEINTTMTGVDATGVAPPPLIEPRHVSAVVPIQPRAVIESKPRQVFPEVPGATMLLAGYDPAIHSKQYIQNIQSKLCVGKDERGTITPRMNALVEVYQYYINKNAADVRIRVNGQLTQREMTTLSALKGECPADRANYYEWRDNAFAQGVNSRTLIQLLNSKLVKLVLPAEQMPTNADVPVDTVRAKIRLIRTKIPKLFLDDSSLTGQFTPDLMDELFK